MNTETKFSPESIVNKKRFTLSEAVDIIKSLDKYIQMISSLILPVEVMKPNVLQEDIDEYKKVTSDGHNMLMKLLELSRKLETAVTVFDNSNEVQVNGETMTITEMMLRMKEMRRKESIVSRYKQFLVAAEVSRDVVGDKECIFVDPLNIKELIRSIEMEIKLFMTDANSEHERILQAEIEIE